MYIYCMWECYGRHEYEDCYMMHEKKFTKEEFKFHAESAKAYAEYLTVNEVAKQMKELFGYCDLTSEWDYDLGTGEVE